jgi:uncharacterized protein (DUF2235 family)
MNRRPLTHVVILDGTMSTLQPELESNAGLTYKLLCETARRDAQLSLRYEEGIQWCTWGSLIDVIAGRGITRQIRRAYGFIAARYRSGDRIFLLGFSRGAFAARSLAGVIDRIGLLRRENATERNIRQVFRYYRTDPGSTAARSFAARFCFDETRIEMIGVWDTVKALGISLPVLWRLAPQPTEFHSYRLGNSTRNGFQALALDETRVAFSPVLWQSRPDWPGAHLEQVWFRGAHGDVGGHIGGFHAARPLANIPLVWMLERAEICGLALPEGWRKRFETDPLAPAHGALRGIAKFYFYRRKRRVLFDPSEAIHPSVETYLSSREKHRKAVETQVS